MGGWGVILLTRGGLGEGWSKSWNRVEVSVVHCTKLETGLNNLETTPFWQTKKSLDR